MAVTIALLLVGVGLVLIGYRLHTLPPAVDPRVTTTPAPSQTDDVSQDELDDFVTLITARLAEAEAEERHTRDFHKALMAEATSEWTMGEGPVTVADFDAESELVAYAFDGPAAVTTHVAPDGTGQVMANGVPFATVPNAGPGFAPVELALFRV